MSKNQSPVSRRTFLSKSAILGALGAGGMLTACLGGGGYGNMYTPLFKDNEMNIFPKKYQSKIINQKLFNHE